MSARDIATEFYNTYYGLFDSGAAGIQSLAGLYRAESMLSFEGSDVAGAEDIIAKLLSLNFTQVKHDVKSFDAQPSGVPDALLISVQGDMIIEGNEHPVKFSQFWHIINDNGNFWVHNDMFRLNYG